MNNKLSTNTGNFEIYTDNLDSISRNRDLIRQSLIGFLSPIPKELWQDYLDFQKKRQRRFLYQINMLALLAYFLFGIADYYVVPDIGMLSLTVRFFSVILFTLIAHGFFQYCQRIEWLDLYLPYTTIIATIIWFALLSQSSSRDVLTFQYGSVIFIVLANIGVQVRFFSSIIPSLLIALCTCIGVYIVSGYSMHELFIFSFAYFPIACFSLYIGWNSTLKNRQNFLHSKLDENSRKALNQMAHTDALTSLHNRRYFEQLATEHIERSRQTNYPLCLLLLDVDHFKKINDTYGHDIGDEILKMMGKIAKDQIRENDLLARFGGEEFIILLTDTHIKQAQAIADRICDVISKTPYRLDAERQIHFTISIGFARFLPHCHDLRALIKSADLALYTAKQQGRNRVVMHHNPT